MFCSSTNDLRREIIRHQGDGRSSKTRIDTVVLTQVERDFGSDKFVLGPLDLKLSPGQFTVIFGNNGSGKTTLLRIVAGALAVTKGSITFPALGRENDWISIKSQISFISSNRFRSELSVRHTFEFIAAAYGKLGKANQNTIDDYLARYDLERFSNSNWSQLSDGYLMRVESIRALVGEPKLLVLDEPLAHLQFLREGDILCWSWLS